WLHEIRSEFWPCSRPETATPPALAAFAGPNRTPLSSSKCMAVSVVGMLAPSTTPWQPLAISVFASASSSSFCVAHGKARSHATVHGVRPSRYVQPRSEEHTSELQSL